MRELAADSGYASADSYEQTAGLGVLAYIPPKPNAKHQAATEARARVRTRQGIEAKIDRTVHAEGAIAELKRHGLTRARSRGTRKLQLQLLAAATAINLKRLLAHPGAQSASDDEDQQSRTLRSIASTSARHITATWLQNILTATLNEIDRLAATDTSTGS